MSTSKWFTYERDFARKWTPVVYHGNKPGQNASRTERSSIHEVPTDCVDEVGEPMFGALVTRFPAPVDPVEQIEGLVP